MRNNQNGPYMRIRTLIAVSAALLVAGTLVSCSNKTKGTEEPKDVTLPVKTLVVVDVQRDFYDPSGSLYVTGSEVLPEKIADLAGEYDAVVFTLDWHPGNHCSFKEEGGIWPKHCVQNTVGAGLPDCFTPILSDPGRFRIFLKGTQQDKEQYGAFETAEEIDPVILSWFESSEEIDVCGIAGDYCVKESTSNLLNFVPAEKVTMLLDCIRSIDDGTALKDFVEEKGLKTK